MIFLILRPESCVLYAAGLVVCIDVPCAAVVFPAVPVIFDPIVIFDPAGLFIPPGILFNVTVFEKVFPPSLLARISGFSIPVLFESHMIATLLPDALIVTLPTTVFGFVPGLMSGVFAYVFPPSLLFVNNTWLKQSHAAYILLPDTAKPPSFGSVGIKLGFRVRPNLQENCSNSDDAWTERTNSRANEIIIAIVAIIANSRFTIVNQYYGHYINSIRGE